MTRAATFPRADNKAQPFGSKYRGSSIQPNVVVLHTTEGSSWPTYEGGATAPHLTAKPNLKTKTLDWRQHFPLTMSARALRNEAGGVETNTLNCVQVELIGTCTNGGPGMFWPEAPDWALEQVGEFIAFMHEEWALRLQAPKVWLPYPDSYGQTKARMSFAKWRSFYGVCGHQHVPENVHGDPGHLDIAAILNHAKGLVKPAPKTKQTPGADHVAEIAAKALDSKQSKARKEQWSVIHEAAKTLQK